MTAADFEALTEREAEVLIRWRFGVLADAGYDPVQALRLAVSPAIRLQAAVEMLRDSGPPSAAAA